MSNQPPSGPNPFSSPQIPNPYSDTGFYGPPPKRNSGLPMWIIVLILGVLGVGGISLVGCCGGFVWFGLNIVSEQVADSLAGNPVIKEHIGDVTSCKTDFTKTVANNDEDVMVFRVEGSKGKGWIYGKTNDETNALLSGELRMEDGKKYDLFPELPAEAKSGM